jgi:tetratricopeptide (TPR) repeat protein
LHNIVDMSSEFPGVVLGLAVCAAVVTGGTGGVDAPRALDVWARKPRELAWTAVALASFAIFVGVPCLGRLVYDDRVSLRRAALDPGVSQATFHAEVRDAMLRHPAEPYLPFTGALRASRAGDESVVGWVERTLERAPVYGPAHFVLARALSARSPAQARLEYRLASEQAPELFSGALDEPMRLVHGYEDAVEVVAHGPGRAASLDRVVRALSARLPATAARLDAELLRIDPASPYAAERLARVAVSDLQEGDAAPWCSEERRACLDRALRLSSRVQSLDPSRCQGFQLHAEALLAGGDAAAAVKELSQATERVSDRTFCLERLAVLSRAAHLDPPLTETLDQISRAGCADVKECVANLEWVAGFERQRGNPRRALSLLRRAAERDPGNDDLLVEVGGLASALDLHAEALRAYEDLARRHPDEAKWGAAVATERAALLGSSANL